MCLPLRHGFVLHGLRCASHCAPQVALVRQLEEDLLASRGADPRMAAGAAAAGASSANVAGARGAGCTLEGSRRCRQPRHPIPHHVDLTAQPRPGRPSAPCTARTCLLGTQPDETSIPSLVLRPQRPARPQGASTQRRWLGGEPGAEALRRGDRMLASYGCVPSPARSGFSPCVRVCAYPPHTRSRSHAVLFCSGYGTIRAPTSRRTTCPVHATALLCGENFFLHPLFLHCVPSAPGLDLGPRGSQCQASLPVRGLPSAHATFLIRSRSRSAPNFAWT